LPARSWRSGDDRHQPHRLRATHGGHRPRTRHHRGSRHRWSELSGGRGTILGTVIGTLLISFLRNGCTLLGISTNVQLIVIGAIIVAAVSLDQVAREKTK